MIKINTLKGYEHIKDYYWVLKDGRILSKYKRIEDERYLEAGLSDGYRLVCLSDSEGNQKTYKCNRVVATAFIDNPENKPYVNHVNEIKDDDRVENLEWSTALENNIHGTRIERASNTRTGTRNKKVIPIETWETKAVFRPDFKKTCKRRELDFEDFNEIFAEFHIYKDGRRGKKYFYKRK